jgi:hypothetical protein
MLTVHCWKPSPRSHNGHTRNSHDVAARACIRATIDQYGRADRITRSSAAPNPTPKYLPVKFGERLTNAVQRRLWLLECHATNTAISYHPAAVI